jgi:N-formylglutamate amidohydrolase
MPPPQQAGYLRFALLALCVSLGTSAVAQEAATTQDLDVSRYVRTQAGELPIILSAPHGGALQVPDVDVRRGEGLAKGPSGFVASRDGGTEELAEQLAAAIERRFGKRPYVVFARSHRKYLDPNRPAHIAYEDSDAKPVYDHYHGKLADYCRDVQQRFRRGLLLDIHGQGSRKDTIFRGTQDGKTVTLLRTRFGEGAQIGASSLFGQLKARGWSVHPDPLDGQEQQGYRGGYIVQTYGSHQGYGIDAVQLEFGQTFRDAKNRKAAAATLTDALANYAETYLDLKPAE